MTVRAIGPRAKGDVTEIMGSCGVVQGRAMAIGATPSPGMTASAPGKLEIGNTMTEVAVITVSNANQIGGPSGIMAGGTSRGGGDVAQALVIRLDIAGVVGRPIGAVTGLTINTRPALAIGNLLQIGGIVTAGASKSACAGYFADMLHGPVTVVAVAAR